MNRKRGIYLGTALLLTLVLCMFLGAAATLAPGWFSRARLHSDQDRAEQAALSGVEYALARLRQNPHYAFGGRGNTPWRVTLDNESMYVVEDHGNIVGLVWEAGATTPSQFRLRFNPQAGGKLNLDLPQLSLNNVPGAGETAVPGSDAKVPGHSVYLAVEGRAGQALSTLSRQHPNQEPEKGALSSKLIQAVYRIYLPAQEGLDSVVASAGDVQIDLPPGQGDLELRSATSQPSRVRAKGAIDVQGGGTPAVTSPKKGQLSSSQPASASHSPRVSVAVESEAAPFLRLPWEPLNSENASRLAAGVYVVDDAKNLLYFDMTPEDYVAWISVPANAASLRGRSGDDYTLPSAMRFLPGDEVSQLVISQEVEIQATDNSDSFAFMPRRGAPAGPALETEELKLDNLEAEHFLLFSRRSGNNYSDEGYGGTEFGKILNDYLYSYYRQSDPGLTSEVVRGTLKVAGQNVEVTATADGHYQIRNLRPQAVKQFLRELARLSPPDSAAPQQGLQTLLAAGAGNAVAGATDSLTTDNLQLQIAGEGRLRSPGRVVVGASVDGGGSIIAGDDIVLYGFGGSGPPQSVSLYSKKDISLQSYHEGRGYFDICLKGILYAWGNISALAQNSDFRLIGALISYGGDPQTHSAPVRRACLIFLKARRAALEFDPAYSLNLMAGLPEKLQFGRTSWSIR